MSQPGTYDEVEALKLLAEGRQKGFTQIYDRYAKGISNLGYKYLHSEALVEDYVQEVFLAVWLQRESFQDVDFFRGYLFTIAKNTALKKLKKIANEELRNEEYFNLKPATSENNIDDYLLNKDMRRAVEELPSTQRTVFQLVVSEGLSHKDVAEQLNLSQQTVSNTMTMAVKTLKLQLKLYSVGGLHAFYFSQRFFD